MDFIFPKAIGAHIYVALHVVAHFNVILTHSYMGVAHSVAPQMVDAHMVDAHIRHCPTLMVDARHVNDRQDTQQHQQEGTLSHTGIWTILISVELPSLQYILLYKHSTNY